MRGFFGALLVLFLIVLGVGLYLGWFSFTVDRNAEGQKTGVSFNVNRQQVGRDYERAGQTMKDLGKKIAHRTENSPAAGNTHTVKGTLMNADAADRQLTLNTVENRPITVLVQPDTKIRRHDVQIDMDGLVAGDHLQVIYRDENGKHVAESVTAEPGA